MKVACIHIFDVERKRSSSWEEVSKILKEDPSHWSSYRLSSGARERIAWTTRNMFEDAPIVALWSGKGQENSKASCMCRTADSYDMDQKQTAGFKDMSGIVVIVEEEQYKKFLQDR